MKNKNPFLEENWFKISIIATIVVGLFSIILIQLNHNKNQTFILQKQIELKEKEIELKEEELVKKGEEEELKKQQDVQDKIASEKAVSEKKQAEQLMSQCILEAQNRRKKIEIGIFLDADSCLSVSEDMVDGKRCTDHRDKMLSTIKQVYLEWESNCKQGIPNQYIN